MTTKGRTTAADMSILFDVWLLSNLTSGLLDDALLETGMSGDEFGLYSLLRGFGPATPTQISRWTGLGPTTVSAALKRLSQRGHTERQPNPGDGRSYLVGLTPEGVAAHASTGRTFLAQVETLNDLLGNDEPALRQALQALDAVLRQATGADPRPYQLEGADSADSWQLAYEGGPLTSVQERDVRRYIDFIRTSTPRT
jgi:DNA-binding MarR family transcriptional regulator